MGGRHTCSSSNSSAEIPTGWFLALEHALPMLHVRDVSSSTTGSHMGPFSTRRVLLLLLFAKKIDQTRRNLVCRVSSWA